LLHSDAAALELATYLLDPEPEPRFTSLNTAFAMMSSAERDTVAVIDIGDTITIEKSFAPGTNPASLAQNLSIEGIEHSINVNNGHIVTYYTSPTTVVYEFILDDPTFGILTADNALG
jgi:hypothetical protein